MKLLKDTDVPEFIRYKFISSGYRPFTPSLRACIRLTFLTLNNETLNVWTNFIALAYFVWRVAFFHSAFVWPEATGQVDQLMIFVLAWTYVWMISVSLFYHVFQSFSVKWAIFLIKCDYAAIVSGILVSFIVPIYFVFANNTLLQKFYLVSASILCVVGGVVLLHPRLQGPSFRALRANTMIGVCAYGLIPLLHAIVLADDHFRWVLLFDQGAVLFLMGVAVIMYLTRFPESLFASRKSIFATIGGSHALWHVFTTWACMKHLANVERFFLKTAAEVLDEKYFHWI